MNRTGTLGFIIRSGTASSVFPGEAFDLTVAAGVFDRPVSVCFQGAGLMHLASLEPPPHERSVTRLWQSAGLFGVDAFYALNSERNHFERVVPGPQADHVQWLSTSEWQAILANWEQVMVV